MRLCGCVHTHLILQLAGILLFTGSESETYLGQFCREEINLSDASKVKISAKMEYEISVIWPLLVDLNSKETRYLPSDDSSLF